MGCKASKPQEEGAHSNSAAKATPSSQQPPPVKEVHAAASKHQKQPEQHNNNNNNNSTKPTPRKKRTIFTSSSKDNAEAGEKLYRLLGQAQTNTTSADHLLAQVTTAISPSSSRYQNPNTLSTPLHMAVRLLETCHRSQKLLLDILQALLQAHPAAVGVKDASGHIPLHYVIDAATTVATSSEEAADSAMETTWELRASVVRMLLTVSSTDTAKEEGEKADGEPTNPQENVKAMAQKQLDYLHRNNVVFQSSNASPSNAAAAAAAATASPATGGCSPLYRALQTLPDDFHAAGPTVRYIQTLLRRHDENSTHDHYDMVSVGNAADGDKPLALLYRRFTRQFDLAEKFFSGDNSRPVVVQHRRQYKTAAGNTWKIVECLLQQQQQSNMAETPQSTASGSVFHVVHRAVQVETPPDLLRYIVETNPEELTVADEEMGRLPLHYAALSKPRSASAASSDVSNADDESSFPAFYSKYVIDELLYKFPEAASQKDGDGNYPLTLAINAGKQWIGGGIKSLYDAYPEAVDQVNLDQHPMLQEALSLASETSNNSAAADKEASPTSMDEEKKLPDTVIRDEQYDAIMLVQQAGVHVSEVVCSMWAHEEDAGVQMLGSVALTKMARQQQQQQSEQDNSNTAATDSTTASSSSILRIALSAVPAVVNSMKAHPNEVIVQEKACQALQALAGADGHCEVSFVASGAVAAIVGAMQAHVSDAAVQSSAAAAIAAIIRQGGEDRATIVASVSGLTAIVNALAAHPDDVHVQEAGCLALRELTEWPGANLPDLPRSQAGPLLEAAKTKFPAECGATVDVLLSRTAEET